MAITSPSKILPRCYSFLAAGRGLAALLLALAWLGVSASGTLAAPETKDVPDALKPWIPWVLHGKEEAFCPARFDNADERLCAWPTRLELDLRETGGAFKQRWRVFKRGWAALAGSTERWPSAVTVDGQPAVVTDRNGTPSVRLEPGLHEIAGKFSWTGLPKSLRVPPAAGLIDLKVNGKPEAFPDFDAKGNLWLRQRETTAEKQESRLVLRVFRQIVDDQPLRVITRIHLDVAGDQREVVLGPVLMDKAIPLSLDSPLPARLEAQGSLRVQIRPGNWVINTIARQPGPVDALSRPQADPPWPDDEVWVFRAFNQLRLVDLSGGQLIDPRQTSLPPQWRDMPAYRMKKDDTLRIATKRRGDPNPAPDQLKLSRTIWLDFDGRGYTARDRITGAMSSGWRLDMNPPSVLGRVSVNGQDQFITRSGNNGMTGVELRQGRINLSADSRVATRSGPIPAVGWDHDVQQLGVEFRLPPGWKLFHAGGADSASNTWLGQWDMWSLFHVLIIALAIAKLWNWRWGAVSLVTLVLIYHEAYGLGWALLSVLAAVAILRKLPESGKLRFAVTWYRNLSLLAVVLVVLPFMISEVRLALYPQLELPWEVSVATDTGGYIGGARRARRAPAPAQEAAPMAKSSRRLGVSKNLSSALQSQDYLSSNKPLVQFQYDPSARITTGPGVPGWRWNVSYLNWSGPVAKDQVLDLVLISPRITSVLRAIGALLAGVLTLLMLSTAVTIRLPHRGAKAAALALLAAGLAVTATSDQARADFPDKAMLDQLRDRLLEKRDCFPACAQLPVLALTADGGRLSGYLEVMAAEGSAIPLPGNAKLWRLGSVALDAQPVEALRRDDDGTLWIYVPKGLHVITLRGRLANESSIALSLPLRPHKIAFDGTGWRMDGADENGVPQAQIRLTRIRDDSSTQGEKLEPSSLPSFARVERTLVLGLSWSVVTQVTRDAATHEAVVIQVPLLPGESVTSDKVRVKDGDVLVNMTPGQRSFSWSSTLERADTLTLTAPETTEWAETWQLDASPIWHVSSQGLAPVFHQDRQSGTWRPRWRPWPGEKLTLKISRPEGVGGRTLTIDQSQLSVQPGQRATDMTLTLGLRSSQGQQYDLHLPKGIKLTGVRIDNKPQPIRARDGVLTLPIAPGRHTVVVKWQEARSIETVFETSRIDLGAPSVNSKMTVSVPRNRWVLWVWGPQLGPAVLFWGVLVVLAAIAFVLHRVPLTPLTGWSWFLLGIGLTQTSTYMAVLIALWLLALGARGRLPETVGKATFNLTQIGLAILTVVALGGLFAAVYEGLLGRPEMQIVGNGSGSYFLRWYQDHADNILPQAHVISVNIWIYKGLMLVWAMWLAFALVRWAKWGWTSYSAGGLWRSFRISPPPRPGSDPSGNGGTPSPSSGSSGGGTSGGEPTPEALSATEARAADRNPPNESHFADRTAREGSSSPPAAGEQQSPKENSRIGTRRRRKKEESGE